MSLQCSFSDANWLGMQGSLDLNSVEILNLVNQVEIAEWVLCSDEA